MKIKATFTDKTSAKMCGERIKREALVKFDTYDKTKLRYTVKQIKETPLFDLTVFCKEGTILPCETCGASLVQREERDIKTSCALCTRDNVFREGYDHEIK